MLNSGGVSSDSQGRIGDPFVTVHGMYLEKADQESGLMTQIGSIGVYIHASSGEVNLRGRDPLDEIKVLRGEVDWVHIAPSPAWVSHKMVLTKIVKVVSCCASKKHSLECCKLCRFEVVGVQGDLSFVGHQHCAPSCQIRAQVVTNVQWWSPDMDCQQVVDTFKERLDLKVPDHNRVAGKRST